MREEDEKASMGTGDGSESSTNILNDRVVELEAEVAKLKGQLSQAKSINDTMWETIAERVLKQDGGAAPVRSGNEDRDVDMIPLDDGDQGAKKARK